MDTIVNPTTARKNLSQLIKNVNRDSQPVAIEGTTPDKSTVMLSKADCESIQETLELFKNGQLRNTVDRLNDDEIDIDKAMTEVENE